MIRRLNLKELPKDIQQRFLNENPDKKINRNGFLTDKVVDNDLLKIAKEMYK
jgi:hypothetical protein